jgi:hypothetical protein
MEIEEQVAENGASTNQSEMQSKVGLKFNSGFEFSLNQSTISEIPWVKTSHVFRRRYNADDLAYMISLLESRNNMTIIEAV